MDSLNSSNSYKDTAIVYSINGRLQCFSLELRNNIFIHKTSTMLKLVEPGSDVSRREVVLGKSAPSEALMKEFRRERDAMLKEFAASRRMAIVSMEVYRSRSNLSSIRSDLVSGTREVLPVLSVMPGKKLASNKITKMIAQKDKVTRTLPKAARDRAIMEILLNNPSTRSKIVKEVLTAEQKDRILKHVKVA